MLAPAPAGSGITINGVRASTATASVCNHTVYIGRVGLAEHLLAACNGLGVTDLTVTVKGHSLPLLDGSALPWTRALLTAGLVRTGRIEPLRLRRKVTVASGNRVIVALPAARLALTCLALAPDGSAQTMSWRAGAAGFLRELAPARTFGPVRGGMSLVARLKLGFAVRETGGWLVPARTRLDCEACRHKLLDLLGDLALLNRPLVAAVLAVLPGHQMNRRLVRMIEKEENGG